MRWLDAKSGTDGEFRVARHLALSAVVVAVLLSPASASAEPCPNDLLRAENNSTQLPDCRAYELVTPQERFGQLLGTPSFPAYAAVSPDGPVFYKVVSQGTFGDASNGLEGNFVATRDAGGWQSIWVGLPASDHPTFVENEAPMVGAASHFATLFFEAVFGIDPNDQNTSEDVYARNADGSSSWVSQNGGVETARIRSTYVGSSADGSHALFVTAQALTPDDSLQRAGLALYDRFEGQTHLVGVRTDGSLTSACGAVLGGSRQGGTEITHVPSNHSVSDDASSIFFESPDPAAAGDASCSPSMGGSQPVELYVRQSATTTTEISLSQRTGSVGSPAPDGASYSGASTDGSRVFFNSPDQLTNDAKTSGGLYEYALSTGVLTFIANGAPLLSAQKDPQISADGTHVYFTGDVPGTGPHNGLGSLYLWDEGHISYIAPAPEGSAASDAQMSADGATLAFTSGAKLTGYDSHGQFELYVYKATSGSLVCVSCDPNGAAPLGAPGLGFHGTYLPNHVVTADGRIVFFDSPNVLAPSATDGKRNVYEYENGAVHLLSDGTGPYESRLIGASTDGTDVILNTADSLLPQALDNGEGDLYDVRVGGGFAPPSTPLPCQGETCKPPLSSPPPDQTPGSLSFDGPGNPAPAASPPVKPKTAAQVKAEKLAKALKVCRGKKNKHKRAVCNAQARKRYGSASKPKRAPNAGRRK